jgi:hypothetical protein
VDNFDQSDLNDEDVFLLDTYTQVFVWIGSQSSQEEKTKAVEFAQRYVAEVDDGRDRDIPIMKINAGQEPPMFSCHFLGWDNEFTKKRSFRDPYQVKLEAMAAEKAGKAVAFPAATKAVAPSSANKTTSSPSPTKAAAPATVAAVASSAPSPPAAAASNTTAGGSGSYADPASKKVPYDSLKSGLPEGVDPAHKEEYLDDASFQSMFGMDRIAFRALPKWKRDDAKKKHGLF